jgi:DNA replication and repair protein RecF
MWFESLRVLNVRCLESLEYRPEAGCNLVCGANASGKTSLLEAFAMASLGKSFLTHRTADVVRSGTEGLSVHAVVVSGEGFRTQVAVRKDRGETRISADGQILNAASLLAQRVPTLVINSKAPDLLTASPSNRRALIDRTMFHVEPEYVETWKRYRQSLRQRNMLLRQHGARREAGYWNRLLAGYAQSIDRERRAVIETVNRALASAELFPGLGKLSFDYRPGWSAARPLAEQLDANWSRDCHAGHTMIGAHRADMSLCADGAAVSKRLSRGQGKAVVCAVVTALAGFVKERTGQTPALLIDDLAAELDDRTRTRVVDMIDGIDGQRIYTAIKPADLPEIADRVPSVFHVEHHQVALMT